MEGQSTPRRGIRCARCGVTAKFLTPHGALCSDHALLASVSQVSEDPWYPLPIHLNWKDRKEVRSAIGSDRYRPGS